MMVAIEIQHTRTGSLSFNPKPTQCAVVVRDKEGSPMFCQPFIKPDNISFEELYKLNDYPSIIEAIYVSGLQAGMKTASETDKLFVARAFEENDMDYLKDWCGYSPEENE